jgi:phage-related protein
MPEACHTSPTFASLQESEQAAMLRTIDLLEQYGPLLGRPHVEHIDGKLWELKAGAGRVFYFCYINGRFVLLCGYRKKSQKAPRQEISRALRYMEDLLAKERSNE